MTSKHEKMARWQRVCILRQVSSQFCQLAHGDTIQTALDEIYCLASFMVRKPIIINNITAYNSRSLSVLHDTSARARAHQHPNRKRHGVQQKKCLWSSETTVLYAHHAACVTAEVW